MFFDNVVIAGVLTLIVQRAVWAFVLRKSRDSALDGDTGWHRIRRRRHR